jgi:arabidopsis histidine kinase 2/3/4 (cytokinin receptor)
VLVGVVMGLLLKMKMQNQHHPLASKLQETFAEYTARTAFERPLPSGVAYAQRVVNSERERFEKQHRVVIKTMEREASQVRDEYAPVIFAQETVLP